MQTLTKALRSPKATPINADTNSIMQNFETAFPAIVL